MISPSWVVVSQCIIWNQLLYYQTWMVGDLLVVTLLREVWKNFFYTLVLYNSNRSMQNLKLHSSESLKAVIYRVLALIIPQNVLMTVIWKQFHVFGLSWFSVNESWQGLDGWFNIFKPSSARLSSSLMIFLKLIGLQITSVADRTNLYLS